MIIRGRTLAEIMGEEPKPGEAPNIFDTAAPVLNPDIINSPRHYTAGGIETIDFMKAKSTPEEFRGYLRLTVLKYLSRGPYKSAASEDYKKARWFLNRLIEEFDNERK